MLKNDEYCLSAIVGAPHTLYCNDSIMDVVNSSNNGAVNVDASMLELNTPINNVSYGEVEQRFSVARQVQQSNNDSQLLGDSGSMSGRIHGGKHFGPASANDNNTNRCVINGRVAKSTQRPFRREPHNYDKAQPTMHQTNLYQQMLAEQQKNQQQQHVVVSSFQASQQQQLAQQQPFSAQATNAFNNQSFISSYADNYQHQQQLNVKVEPLHADVLSLLNDNAYNSIGYKPYPQFKKSASTGTFLNVPRQTQQQQSYLQQEPPQMQQSLPVGMGNQQILQLTRQQQVNNTQQQQHQSTVASLLQQQHQQQNHQQQQLQTAVSSATWVSPNTILPKEIYRSNSLPLNVSLNKLPDGRQLHHEQPFAVPKYHSKSKSRVRSNSMHQQHTSVVSAAGAGSSSLGAHSCSNLLVTQQMQQATSDPMLNSTLAQLLTSSKSFFCILRTNCAKIFTILDSRLQTAVANSSSSNSPSVSAIATTNSNSNAPPVHYANVTSPLSVPVPTHQHSPKKSASLPMAVNSALHSPPLGSKIHGIGLATANVGSNSLSLSPESTFHESQDSPLSPTTSLKFQPRDTQRRAGHIHAEQKRRYNIKNGFDTLHALIPQLQLNPNAKLSKAAMLQKGADHIKQLRQERNVLKDKIEALRMERDELNNSLT